MIKMMYVVNENVNVQISVRRPKTNCNETGTTNLQNAAALSSSRSTSQLEDKVVKTEINRVVE